MINDNMPTFKDDEDKYLEKARSVVQEELNKQRDHETQKNISDKVRRIKHQFSKIDKVEKVDAHKSEDAFCPNCHNHKLHVHDDTAKCTGPDCGKEFLLVEKKPNVRNSHFCTSCGTGLKKDDAQKLVDNDSDCPFCNKKNTKLMEIDWSLIDNIKNNK